VLNRLSRRNLGGTIDAHEIRELQRPLKQLYQDDPSRALIPAFASAVVHVSDVTCRVSTGTAEVVAGLHAAAGGTGELACSADMLLEALVACAGVTFASVASAMSVPITSCRITADGQWDARGTLAVDREAPVGLTDIALRFEIEADADPETVARLVQLTERYCVIVQTLIAPPHIAVTHSVVEPR
jgi:uncharacterized OsmC-like protein